MLRFSLKKHGGIKEVIPCLIFVDKIQQTFDYQKNHVFTKGKSINMREKVIK